MNYLIFAVLGYLSGSVLYAYYLPLWLCGIDITADAADGNPGVFNCVKQAGKAIGLTALVCDLLKGALPVLLAVGGIVLLIFRKQATEVVPFCIGVWALVLGVVKTVVAVQYAAARVRNWWVQIIPAALGILMGILILTGTVNLNAIFTVLMGVYLVLLGIFNIVDFFVFRHRMMHP